MEDFLEGDHITIRPVEDADLGDIVALDEKISGKYRPDVWERRLGYYMRRDPDASVVAQGDHGVLGFMLGEVRSGEFGLEEPTGWIEVLGVDPAARGKSIGRRLAAHMLDHFRAKGAVKVRTLVDGQMEDIASFFSSIGFEPADLRAYVMQLDRREKS
jgi:ribosomal protein S18 acetylase RimI-like enzyme